MQAPDRVAISLFGIDILWYGVFLTVGIVLTILVITKRAPAHRISSDRILNYCIIAVLCGIVGARMYYVFFRWEYYSEDLGRILNLREGGLAVHGGLLFGLIVLLILCKIWKDRPLNVLDLFASAVPLGQAIGRWGNFFNEEAYGGPTDLPWAQIIDGQKVHPTFLYESIWCFLLFLFLQFLDRRRSFHGQIFLLYVILYSLERFFVEGLRTDSLMLTEHLRQAQVLSALAFFVAGCAYIYLWRKKKYKKTRKRRSAS
ncbi:MAG: prolipoprotein diacylglyceryl transferase [Clostridiales Family XIII bacterium]|jgi:phosphatidylglycerol:prolipoprotein diacylglycerol transferase|nr:prolipoprotein diacylglyceryl transferase [Clostridiales Family XIII bacterium]